MTSHTLKILPQYFRAVVEGKKTFEVRKKDRDYKVGDYLCLMEFDRTYSGLFAWVEVTYILDDERYCKDGYVVMGIKYIR